MTTWEVILLIAGFACLCISFYVSRNSSENESEDGEQGASAVWTEKEEELIKERVRELLQEMQNEFVEGAGDEMSRLCNDKIMAIDEFSKQLLEKIESNHKEVVFMYNMMTEKQKEVANILAKAATPEPVTKEAVKPAAAAPLAQEKKRSVPQKPAAGSALAAARQKKLAAEAAAAGGTAVRQGAAAVQKAAGQGQATVQRQAASQKQTALQRAAVSQKAAGQGLPAGKENTAADDAAVPAMDVNQQIQKMYREGKSVLEISKALNMGQGEVKLVITLYGGRGR